MREICNTIARLGAIDANIHGSNGWYSGYAVLQEQWIAQLGLAIDDPYYFQSYAETLDYQRDHAIGPDGRVKSRWFYGAGDAMPGTYDAFGFYECQWGWMLDSQPCFVTNVAEQFDFNGDVEWVRRHKATCEKALDYMLRRDSNGNGLVEMMTDSHTREERRATGSTSFGPPSRTAWSTPRCTTRWCSGPTSRSSWAMPAWRRSTAGGRETQGDASTARSPRAGSGIRSTSVTSIGATRTARSTARTWSRRSISWRSPTESATIRRGGPPSSIRSKRKCSARNSSSGRCACRPISRTKAAAGRSRPTRTATSSWPGANWAPGLMPSTSPAVAVRIVKNVIDKYRHDGLAFQRYLRKSQTGEGGDILSNMASPIVGLYRNIYGIQPKWNRLYLDPHLTPELGGTQLKYWLRGQTYLIDLKMDDYGITVGKFTVRDKKPFAVDVKQNTLSYFSGARKTPSMTVTRSNGGTDGDSHRNLAGGADGRAKMDGIGQSGAGTRRSPRRRRSAAEDASGSSAQWEARRRRCGAMTKARSSSRKTRFATPMVFELTPSCEMNRESATHCGRRRERSCRRACNRGSVLPTPSSVTLPPRHLLLRQNNHRAAAFQGNLQFEHAVLEGRRHCRRRVIARMKRLGA